jgi:hypothetical protein
MVGSLDGRSVVYGSKDGKVIRYNTSYFSINNKWAQSANKNNCKIPVAMGIELKIDRNKYVQYQGVCTVPADLLGFLWDRRKNVYVGTTQTKNNTDDETDHWLFQF